MSAKRVLKVSCIGLIALVMSFAKGALGDSQVISSFEGNGQLTWSNSLPLDSNSTYTVQWASDLTSGNWCASWSSLSNIPILLTNTVTVSVPMFYRVVLNTFLYVSTNGNDNAGNGTPGNPYATIQKAIDVASNGTMVIVRSGLYSGIGNRNLAINGKNISVVSENGPATTVIDGGGVARAVSFSGTISNCLFSGFTIQNCYVDEGGDWGQGGIVLMTGTVNPIIDRCIIRSNTVVSSRDTAQSGLVTFSVLGGATLRDCLIVSNSVSGGTSDAGGYAALLRSGGGFPEPCTNFVYNCTIADNSLPVGNTRSSLFYFFGEVANVIDWNNTGAQVFTNQLARFDHVLSQTVQTTTAAMTNNPLFSSATDYTLSSSSPCINTGTNMSWMTSAKDVTGNDRIRLGVVDRGAYESQF